jgi:hypothetical protein
MHRLLNYLFGLGNKSSSNLFSKLLFLLLFSFLIFLNPIFILFSLLSSTLKISSLYILVDSISFWFGILSWKYLEVSAIYFDGNLIFYSSK